MNVGARDDKCLCFLALMFSTLHIRTSAIRLNLGWENKQILFLLVLESATGRLGHTCQTDFTEKGRLRGPLPHSGAFSATFSDKSLSSTGDTQLISHMGNMSHSHPTQVLSLSKTNHVLYYLQKTV